MKKEYDIIIIGGSYAGLSAAMALGRSLRKTLIIDSGQPCNRQTPHSHNFITHDGAKPAEIAEKAKIDVLKYNTVEWQDAEVVNLTKANDYFAVSTASGEVFQAKRVVFATGIKDEMLDVPGFSESWGISIVHCPYCHGYEIRNQKTGIIANGDKAVHLAGMLKNLTAELTLLTNGKANFDDSQLIKLNKHSIAINEKKIKSFNQVNGQLKAIVFEDGFEEEFVATYAAVPFKQSSPLIEKIGCELDEMGYIKVDEWNKTTVEGIYAAGDNCTFMRSVANAVASGNKVGAVANMEMVHDTF